MITQLTALRGPLALWVVLYHYVGKSFAPADLGWLQPVVDRGYLAVDAFFVLSGLVVAHTADKLLNAEDADAPATSGRWGSHRMGRSTASFLRARLARIYPVHVTVLALFGLAVAASAWLGRPLPGEYSAVGLAANLLLVDAWGITDGLTWNYPSWAISAQWFTYLLAPVVFLRLTDARRWVQALSVVASLGVLAVADTMVLDLASWTDERSLLRVSAGFSIGVVLASRVRPSSARAPWVLAAAVVGMAVGIAVGLDVITIAAMAVLIAALYAWPSMDLPSWSIALGTWSYTLYLVHALVQVIAQAVVGPGQLSPVGRAVGLVITLGLAVGAAGLLHRAVEAPCRARLRGGSSSARRARGTARGGRPGQPRAEG